MKVKGFTSLEKHNTTIDHAPNLAYKPIHRNNGMEINGQILSCNHQLRSIKTHPAAWPLSTDRTRCWLTQFPSALQQAEKSWSVKKTQPCLLLPWPGCASELVLRLLGCLPAHRVPPRHHFAACWDDFEGFGGFWKASSLPTVVYTAKILDWS